MSLSPAASTRRFRGPSFPPCDMHAPSVNCAAVFLAVLTATNASAQQRQVEFSPAPAMVCELHAQVERVGRRAISAPGSPPAASVRGGSTFEVTYNDFPAEAEEAFQAAVDVWAEHVISPTPIRINASWIPLSSNILGSAGPFLIRNFDAAPIPNTWYAAPLADALTGADLDPGNPDIEATFNSAFPNWYFGVDGNPPPDQYDLTTIVLHEIGHGLGFIGSFVVEDGLGTVGVASDPGLPFVYDRFAEDEIGRPLLDAGTYPLNSTVLADALESAVFFGGQSVEATYGTSAPLYSPPQWNDGSSYSHVDEMVFPTSDEDGLMTPFLQRAEVYRSPGPIPCAFLLDIGWTLAPACAALVVPPDPDGTIPEGFTVKIAGLNPFVSDTELLVAVEQPQVVLVQLVDRVGRVVMRQERFLQGGATVLFRIAAGGLPSGVYFAQVVGDTFAATRAVTIVR